MSSQSLDKQLLDLLIASGAASADRVRELLAAGANVHAHSVGRPAIVWAARGGDVARLLRRWTVALAPGVEVRPVPRVTLRPSALPMIVRQRPAL